MKNAHSEKKSIDVKHNNHSKHAQLLAEKSPFSSFAFSPCTTKWKNEPFGPTECALQANDPQISITQKRKSQKFPLSGGERKEYCAWSLSCAVTHTEKTKIIIIVIIITTVLILLFF